MEVAVEDLMSYLNNKVNPHRATPIDVIYDHIDGDPSKTYIAWSSLSVTNILHVKTGVNMDLVKKCIYL